MQIAFEKKNNLTKRKPSSSIKFTIVYCPLQSFGHAYKTVSKQSPEMRVTT